MFWFKPQLQRECESPFGWDFHQMECTDNASGLTLHPDYPQEKGGESVLCKAHISADKATHRRRGESPYCAKLSVLTGAGEGVS